MEEKRGKRATDGGTYMIVVDEKQDMKAVIDYAKQRVIRNNAYFAFVYVIDTEGYSTWEGVQDMMHKELREKAEKLVWPLAKKVHEEEGMYSSIHIEEGSPSKIVSRIISESENDVRELIIGAEGSGAGSSSLISYFTTKGAADIHIPLVIVPIKQEAKQEKKEEE